MSHIEPHTAVILGRAKMRTMLLKVVAILFLTGLGNARPQITDDVARPESAEMGQGGWKSSARASNASNEVRDDSRYRWNSGSFRLPYPNYNYSDSSSLVIKSIPNVSVNPTATRVPSDPTSRNSKLGKTWFNPVERNTNHTKTQTGSLINSSKVVLRTKQNGTVSNNKGPRGLQVRLIKPGAPRNTRYSQKPLSRRRVVLNNLKRTNAASNLTNPDRQSNSAHDRPIHTKFTEDRKPPRRVDSPGGGPLRNSGSVCDQTKRRSCGGGLNNSEKPAGPSSAQKLKSEFPKSSQVAFPTGSRKPVTLNATLGLKAQKEFDPLDAIKQITNSLTDHNAFSHRLTIVHPKKSSVPGNTVFVPLENRELNRRPSSKHRNRIKNRTTTRKPPENKTKVENKPARKNIVKNKSPLNADFKNWPNEALQNTEDLYNYERYTSFVSDEKEDLEKVKNVSSNYRQPSMDSIQEIIHWLKVPAFATNQTHFVDKADMNESISVTFEPIYQDLQPNEAFLPETQPVIEKNNILRNPFYDANENVQFPLQVPNSESSNPPNSPSNVFFYNKTALPSTEVTQNTIVQILTGSSKTNGTKFSTKPLKLVSNPVILKNSASSDPTKDQVTEEPEKFMIKVPLVTYDEKCPTILINSYTKVNNTIQSKEGCSDLNIIINSHVQNTNVVKQTSSPTPNNPIQPAADYGNLNYNNKLVNTPPASTYSTSNYQTPTHTYTPVSSSLPSSPQTNYNYNNYYDSLNNPQSDIVQANDVTPEVSTVEFFQGTQISITSSGIPSSDTFTNLESPETQGDNEPIGPSGGTETGNDEIPSPVGSAGPEGASPSGPGISNSPGTGEGASPSGPGISNSPGAGEGASPSGPGISNSPGAGEGASPSGPGINDYPGAGEGASPSGPGINDSPGAGEGASPSGPGINNFPGAGEGASPSGPGISNSPGAGEGASPLGPGIGEGASPLGPGISNSPAAGEIAQSPIPGSISGQANNDPVSSALQGVNFPGLPNRPSFSNLPSRPNAPNLPDLPSGGTSGGSSGGSSGHQSTALTSPGHNSHKDDDDDDDDDDDIFGLSPHSLMDSVTSVFTYLTFLNPLNYGLLSMAVAPFAAMAAGAIGFAAFLFPWALPGAFDFGRASDRVTIKFTPSLEEVVRQSMYKYGRVNEWKSRRKKRKR